MSARRGRGSERPPKGGDGASQESAIERVLRAEQDAEARIAEAEREAAARIDAARNQCRLVLDKADRRIARLRQRCGELTRAAVEDVARREQQEAARVEAKGRDAGRRQAAVERLAAWLLEEKAESPPEGNP